MGNHQKAAQLFYCDPISPEEGGPGQALARIQYRDADGEMTTIIISDSATVAAIKKLPSYPERRVIDVDEARRRVLAFWQDGPYGEIPIPEETITRLAALYIEDNMEAVVTALYTLAVEQSTSRGGHVPDQATFYDGVEVGARVIRFARDHFGRCHVQEGNGVLVCPEHLIIIRTNHPICSDPSCPSKREH